MTIRRCIAVVAASLAVPAAASAMTVPTELGGTNTRPPRISYTGDGSAILGGFTRFHGLHKSSPLTDYGRLHWYRWNAVEGWATGANWIDDFQPDGATGTFRPVSARVHVYRPSHGTFTRMTIIERRQTFRLVARGRDGWEFAS